MLSRLGIRDVGIIYADLNLLFNFVCEVYSNRFECVQFNTPYVGLVVDLFIGVCN